MSSPETPQRPSDRAAETTQAMPAVGQPAPGRGGAHQATTYAEPGERGAAQPSTPGSWAEAPAPARQAVAEPVAPAAPRVRRARLLLTRVDPWSVMKLSFLLSIALGIVVVVAVAVLWSVLQGMGVFASINRIVNQVVTTPGSTPFNVLHYIGFKRVVGATTLLGLVNVVLITALSTVAAFLYNLATSLVGGLHVTLSEDS